MAKSLNAKDVLLPATVEATEVMPAASISLEVYSLHEGKFITKTVDLTPEQRAASKEFIAEFAKEYANVVNGDIRPFELMKKLDMSKAIFYRYVNKIRKA